MTMQTSIFVPSTQVLPRQNRSVPGFWPGGIDWGYSGIKAMSPNKVFSLPNCAVKVENIKEVGEPSPTDIVIHDEEGTWIVGDQALSFMGDGDGTNYEMELYGRNRYFSPLFRALIKTGLAFTLSGNQFGYWNPDKEKIVLETGLPPRYKNTDSAYLREALAGKYDFEMRVGGAPFMRYRFEISPDWIFITDQALAALGSSIMDSTGRPIQSQKKIMRQKTICFDGGFKTCDVYEISNGQPTSLETYDNLGMQEVFKRASAEIMKKYGKDMSVPAIQAAARRGYFNAFNRRQMTTEKIFFGDILERANLSVCSEALGKLLNNWNYLQDHENLVVTGGTGDAWFPIISERLRGMKGTLSILSSNRNDTSLSNAFGNARGYYFHLVSHLARKGAF